MHYLAALLGGCFLGLALLHGYWALGGTAGLAAALPAHADGRVVYYPPAGVVWGVAAGLLGVALLQATYCWPAPWLPPGGQRAAEALLAAGLLGRVVGDFRYVGLSKRVHGTTFARLDTGCYTPLCLLLAAGAAVLAAG